MLEICFYVVTYLLALYGAVVLCISMIDAIRQRVWHPGAGVRLILAVKDQEDTIEGIVKHIADDAVLSKACCDGYLTVIDMSSSDSTKEILIKLMDEYENLEILFEEEREKAFEGIRNT